MEEAKEEQLNVLPDENEEKIRVWIERYFSLHNPSKETFTEKFIDIKSDKDLLVKYFSNLRFDENLVRLNSAFLYLGAHIAFNQRPYIFNEFEYIDVIRKGVPKMSVTYFMGISGLSFKHIASLLQMSDRTLRKYEPAALLNREQSERAVELARLYSRGAEVFESIDAFKKWMDSTVMALGNRNPKDFLDTSLGIEMLMDELGRIEHGIFA